MILEVHNSFCTFSNDMPANVYDLVSRVLTYQNDIKAERAGIFYRMKMLKRFGCKKKKDESDQDRLTRSRQTMGLYQKQLKELEANEWICWFYNNSFPTGHLNIVKEVLKASGTQYQLIDKRRVPAKDLVLEWNSIPFTPRYYQKEAINLALEHGRGVIEAAVGTGKSLIMAHIVKELSAVSLIVVPSSGLSDQLYNDFKKWFGSDKVDIIDTKKVRANQVLKPIRIITVQSLASLQKTGELQNLIHDVNALFVDEIHHAGASSYTNLLNELNHIYYRFGFTGTFMRNDGKLLDLWGFLSTVLYRYTATQAIADGFLTPPKFLAYELGGKRSTKYPKEYSKNYCENPEMFQKVADICNSAQGKQVLILVNRKDKGGKIFHEYLNALGIHNAYISGDNAKEEITSTIRAFNNKEVNILIGSSVIGEGIDVCSTDHLIMCQGGKSEIVMVQAIGRAIRLYLGKEVAYIHDFSFSETKFMNKHFKQRVEIYRRNFECEVEYVQAA